MKVIATKEQKSLVTEILIAILAVASVASFTLANLHVAVPAGLALTALFLAYKYYDNELLFVIDEHGIFDARLGVGKILWRDVVDVQIEMCYRTRFLLLKVRNNRRSFTDYNIDLSGMNVNLLSLKSFIENRSAV